MIRTRAHQPQLLIRIELAETTHSVSVVNKRPVQAASLFSGKSIEETLQLMPLLFSICAKAQACASVRAIECAQGITPHPGVQQQRQAIVDIESLREHLWRIFLQWPALSGVSPVHQPMADIIKLQQSLQAVLNSDNAIFRPGVGPSVTDQIQALKLTQQIDQIFQQSLFLINSDQWLEINSLGDLHSWLNTTKTPASTLIKRIIENGWESAASNCSPALPPLDTQDSEQLAQLMQADDYIAQPVWQGYPAETSPLTRNHSSLLTDCQNHFNNGLLTRALAVLTEVAQLAKGLTQWFTGNGNLFGYQKSGAVIGQTLAARGQLFHSAECEKNTIKQYRILAPTEWNFHPLGSVKMALSQLQGSAHEIEQQASLFTELLDPCVAYQITIANRAETHA